MRFITVLLKTAGLALATLAIGQAAYAQPNYTYAPSFSTSDFFVLGQAQSRHNQTLYLPGQFNLPNDSTVLIQRLYMQYGQHAAGADTNTLDSLIISLGQTDSLHMLNNGNFYYFYPDIELVEVLSRAKFRIADGAFGTWFSLPMNGNFIYDPKRSLILDIKFKSSTNAFFFTQGAIRPNEHVRISSRSLTDSAGGLSEVIPFLGFDLALVANRPRMENSALSVYPNPASDRIVVHSQAAFTSPILLTDALGMELLRYNAIGTNTLHMNTANLPAGIYTLRNGGESRQIVLKK